MNTEELRDAARVAYDRELAKQNINTAIESRMTVNYNGGMFIVTQELIAFLHSWFGPNWKDWDGVIFMMDAYDVPVKVIPHELLYICQRRWYEVMNEFAAEYEEFTKVRNARQL
jgi:hypothetical protein